MSTEEEGTERTTETLAEKARDKVSDSDGRNLESLKKKLTGDGEDGIDIIGLLTHTEPHEDLEELHETEWVAHYIRAGKKALNYLTDKDALPLQKTLAFDLFQGTRKWWESRETEDSTDGENETSEGADEIASNA